MLGNSNAGEEKIDPHDVSIRFYKYITIPEDDPAYLCRLISILEAVKIAILFSWTYGPKVSCHGQLYLLYLWANLIDRNGWYAEFLLVLGYVSWNSVKLPSALLRLPAIATATWDAPTRIFFRPCIVLRGDWLNNCLDVFYTTMILTTIRRIVYNSERGTAMGRGSSMIRSACFTYQPMMLALETSNKTFYELCYNIYRIRFHANLKRWHLGILLLD